MFFAIHSNYDHRDLQPLTKNFTDVAVKQLGGAPARREAVSRGDEHFGHQITLAVAKGLAYS